MKKGSLYCSLEIIIQEVKHTPILHSSFFILHSSFIRFFTLYFRK